MFIKTLIVDNDKNCINILRKELQVFSFIKIEGELNNPQDVEIFLQNNDIDLIFLDIEMGPIHGINLARHIREIHPNALIIFVTGYPGFALEGYEVYPVDFLIKPINIQRLEKALNKVKEINSSRFNKNDYKIGINIDNGIKMINISEILYIEKQGRKISVVCKNNEIIYSRESMKNLEILFSSFNFYRPHQSFLVPIKQIKAIYPDKYTRSYTIELSDSKTNIPVSRNKYSRLKEILEEETKGVTIH